MSFTRHTMIRWKLNEVMARYHIKNIELASQIGISQNAVSNLRGSKEMPRIDGNRLNSLCVGLTQLCKKQGENVIVTPFELIEFTIDRDLVA